MSYSTYAVIMLAAGLGIPVMAALNAALGKIIGNPAGAVVMLLLVAMIAAGAICAISGSLSLTTLLTAPKHLFLAGVFAAFYMLSITYISPYFGVGNAARIQLANATSDLSLRNTSFGVLKPRHFLGRLFNLSMMSTTS